MSLTLEDIFQHLSAGELAQVSMGIEDDGNIPENQRKRITSSINLGLTELHKRFLLKEGKIQVVLQPGMQTYRLHSNFAVSNSKSNEPIKYLNDVDVPFTDDVLNIERIYDHEGNELPLNIIDDPLAVRTPTQSSIAVPVGTTYPYVTVVYRANHAQLNPIFVEALPSKVPIDLPISHLEPLLYYVASRILNPVGMVSEFHEGNNYTAKFEAACQRLEQLNMRVDTQGVNNRLHRNGWV